MSLATCKNILFSVCVTWLLCGYFVYIFVSEALEKGWSWIWVGCDGTHTDLKAFQVPSHYVLHNCSGLSLLPNQTGEVCLLLQHRACHQRVLSRLQSGVLEYPLIWYCRGPESTKKLCHLFPLPKCSRPPLAWCSPAAWGQAAVGRAVHESCKEPCWGPPPSAWQLRVSSMLITSPHLCYGAGASTCRLWPACCGGPHSSSGVVGRW